MAVFIPVLFMSGVVGRVFREFAVTISVAILVSGFVSLTLTPMLCSRILSAPKHGAAAGLFYRLSDTFVDGLSSGYRVSLDFVLRWRHVSCSSRSLTARSPCRFTRRFPRASSRGRHRLPARHHRGAPDASFREMSAHQIAVSKLIKDDPAVASVTSAVGFGGASNNGFLFIRSEGQAASATRRRRSWRVAPRDRGIPGISTFSKPVQNSIYRRAPRASDLSIHASGRRHDALYQGAGDAAGNAQLPGLHDVNSDLQISNRALVDIDRDKAAAFGITMEQIRNTFYNAYGTRQISTISRGRRLLGHSRDRRRLPERSRRARSDPRRRRRPDSSCRSTRWRRCVARRPGQVNHQGQLPSVTIAFNLAPGMSLGTAVKAITRSNAKTICPVSITTGFAGNAQVFQQALKGQGLLLPAAVLTIYIVLGILYESYIHPITILSGLPAAGLGALLALDIFHKDLSVIAIIGIRHADRHRQEERDHDDRLRARTAARGRHGRADGDPRGGLIRFRPIMMTTLAAMIGGLPIASARAPARNCASRWASPWSAACACRRC